MPHDALSGSAVPGSTRSARNRRACMVCAAREPTSRKTGDHAASRMGVLAGLLPRRRVPEKWKGGVRRVGGLLKKSVEMNGYPYSKLNNTVIFLK